jgi:hypothetical protein
MKTKPIYKSVQAYADLCGISFQSVIQRQRYGHLEFTYHETAKNPFGNPVKMVDIEKYPPVSAKKRGRKPLV